MAAIRRSLARPVLTCVALTGALCSLAATRATAATELGSTFDPGTSFCGNFLLQSVSPPGDTYAAPFDGVISAWSYQASTGGVQLKLKVGRAAGGNNFLIVGESAVQTAEAAKLNTFPTRISVGAGDVIGLTPVTNGLPCVRGMATGYSYSAYVMGSDVPPGTTATFNPSSSGTQVDIAASLEVDNDKDGFGDDTQDQCPAFVGTSDGCPPNAFSFAKVKRNKAKGTATLKVVVPGAGDLTLGGKGIVKQRPGTVPVSRAASRTIGDAGTVTLKIQSKGKKKRKLRRKGKVKVGARVTYTPTGGKPNSETKRITLRKSAPRQS